MLRCDSERVRALNRKNDTAIQRYVLFGSWLDEIRANLARRDKSDAKPGRLGAYVRSVGSSRRLDQPGDAETGETRQRGGHDDAEARTLAKNPARPAVTHLSDVR